MRLAWREADPVAAADSSLEDFRRRVERETGTLVPDYAALHRWACAEPETFWSLLLRWLALHVEGDAEPALSGRNVAAARFFPLLRINYALNVLRGGVQTTDDDIAVIWLPEDGEAMTLTRKTLQTRALSVAAWLRSRGVAAGDRVAAIGGNTPDLLTVCLGAAAIGGVWSSLAPDLSPDAVISRFEQIEPRVLVLQGEHRWNGRTRVLSDELEAILDRLPSVEVVLILGAADALARNGRDRATFDQACAHPPLDLSDLPSLPFDHPLFILYTSGTTGRPKCVVHGAGGTLLEHLKEHRLHGDLGRKDRLCFITSPGWMMWNWQVSALATGASVALCDGSVIYPHPRRFLQQIDAHGITMLGVSPAYLQMLEHAGIVPRELAPFTHLRAILSTGSVLREGQYDWLRQNFRDVPVQSISGGTDLIGCFVLGNPLLPIFKGDSQCVSLGLDVRVIRDGRIMTCGEGDLVCVAPFPSRPVCFWNDPDGSRIKAAYYAPNPGVWTHGDLVRLEPEGSARILGRSDGVMNVNGVRIGPAEIYEAALMVDEAVDVLAICVPSQARGGDRILLFVILREGVELDAGLSAGIRRQILTRTSGVHVPHWLVQAESFPVTFSGKTSERAVYDALAGKPPSNLSALRNPESLTALYAAAEAAGVPLPLRADA